ncbi:related to ankyrin repeat protein [Cephalotrichum gorgonifer]|uniref:Related to ankyrin repeat protein n=1 Tax=Cephalotrichum gorgonifer TaxID=2041049 RepID=A0AAE8MSW0_9PEZI|nr:related to ankyrin repeat protein [Cephalotrichum gorgonifer]
MSVASSCPDQRQLRLIAASAQANQARVRDILSEDPPWTSTQDLDALRIALQKASARQCLPIIQLLLEHGAEVEPRRENEISALYRAAQTGRTENVSVLLRHGANPNWQDRRGQTALFAAAMNGHAETMKALLEAGALADHKDSMARPVLLVLASLKAPPSNLLECLTVLVSHGADTEPTDAIMRTPLLWAATNGNITLIEALVSGVLGRKANVGARNNRGRTALHLASECNVIPAVEALLAHNAPVNAESDGGWTALHNAAQSGNVRVVELLVGARADVNARLSNGMTPLHWAAFNGHDEVVDVLLSSPETDPSIKDTFYRTPMLCAAEKCHRALAEKLSPCRMAHRLPPVAQAACKAFEAKVVDFNFRGGEQQRVFQHSVYDLLYGWDKVRGRPSVPILPRNVKHEPALRWVHLPANNIAWVETLLAKTFIEGDFSDFEGFKALQMAFDQEHRGDRAHAHFMRSFCQRISAPPPEGPMRRETDKNPLVVVSEEPAPPEESTANGGSAPPGSPRPPSQPPSPNPGDKTPRGEPKKKKKGAQIAERHPKHKRGNGPPGNPQPPKSTKSWPRLSPSATWESAKLSPSNGKILLFIPFLHYETDARREKMAAAIGDVRNGKPIPENASPDVLLVNAYLNNTPPLHPRRTLDQFFYHGIDTSARDRDQVVWRYCKNQKQEPKVFMVDQLWLWVLGTGKGISRAIHLLLRSFTLSMLTSPAIDLVVTCFSQRWDQQSQDHLNVVNGIIEETNAKTRPPITSVYDLAMLITSRCSGLFDRHCFCRPEYQFLDMFDSSIGAAMNCETELFDTFNCAVSSLSPQLQRFVKNNARGDPMAGGTWTDEMGEEVVSPDTLLDIGPETSLLVEIKDIRDELNIISVVLASQVRMAEMLEQLIIEELQAENNRRTADIVIAEMRKRSRELARLLEIYKRDISRMDRQAEIIFVNLTHLLDLKQKHSNALEARFARDQAVLAGKQGQTIMVFTIVTVVFLPMSFIASFFAVDFADRLDGSNPLTMSYVSKYMFGIGLGISIPLIVMAFFIEDFTNFMRRTFSLAKRRILSRGPASSSSASEEGVHGVPLDAYPTIAREMGLEPKQAFSRSSVVGSRARSGSYVRDFEGHAAARLSPVYGRMAGSRMSASSGGAGGRLRYSGDLERGSRPGSGAIYH